MSIEPIHRLVLCLRCSLLLILEDVICSDAKPMAGAVVDLHLPLLVLRLGIHHLLNLLDLRHLQRHVLLAKGEGHWDLDLLDLVGDLQQAGMAREAGIDQGFAVRRLGSVGQIHNVFATPAETSSADGEIGSLVLAHGSEERLDDGP